MRYEMKRGQTITMRDGIALNVNVYLPGEAGSAGQTAWPALLTLTPYTADYVHPLASKYVAAGFAVVVVDVRGRGGSGGSFDLYNDGLDGATCIDWVAEQTWCTGKVGLFGGSYSGLNQWQIAALRPPALHAIAPVCAPMPGFDADFFSGLFPLNNARWAAFVSGKTLSPKVFADDSFWQETFQAHFESGAEIDAIESLLGDTDPIIATMVKHIDDAAFWAARVPTTQQFQAIDVPVLSITGTADNAQRGTLEYRRRHLEARPDAQHFLMIRPWNHSGARDPEIDAPATPDSEVLHTSEHQALISFYRWALNDRVMPFRAKTQVYVAGHEAWVDDPAPTQKRFVVSADQRLVHEAPETAPSRQRAKLTAQPLAQDGNTFSLFDVLGGEKALCQTILTDPAVVRVVTDPLEERLTLCGMGQVSVCLCGPQQQVDMACLVFIEMTDGSTEILSSSYGRVTLAGRQESITAMPDLRFMARSVPSGARLGLALFQVVSPAFQRLPDAAPCELNWAGTKLSLPVLDLQKES